MNQDVELAINSLDETRLFVERALRDFGLMDDFLARTEPERERSLAWIAASPDEKAEEWRVSLLLDALDQGRPLDELSKSVLSSSP